MTPTKVRPGRYLVIGIVMCMALSVATYSFLPYWLWLLIILGSSLAAGVKSFDLDKRHQVARAEDVATLERAESVLTALDDAPPPLPPAIPVSMRDPAFRARIEALELLDRQIKAWDDVDMSKGYEAAKLTLQKANAAKKVKPELLARPLIAERRFTALTHCPHGHVAAHWLGATTDDHDEPCIERICRFERCGATWVEKR